MNDHAEPKRPLYRRILLWLASAAIMVSIFVFQTRTGPTYPLDGTAEVGGETIRFSLLTSEETHKDLAIRIEAPEPIDGSVRYRRFKSHDQWTTSPMQRDRGELVFALAPLETAGKYEYFVYLSSGDEQVSLTGEEPVVARYKGRVPTAILIAHIAFMFLGFLFAIRTALEALTPQARLRPLIWTTLAIVFIGGLILGPIVQKYAFGAFWTGVPFGHDLTDNKTLIAFLGWLTAAIMDLVGKGRRGFTFFATALMFAMYLIPHSVLGSERDYRTEQPRPPAVVDTITDDQ